MSDIASRVKKIIVDKLGVDEATGQYGVQLTINLA